MIQNFALFFCPIDDILHVLCDCVCSFSRYGAQGLTLSKILPHICYLLGDPVSQVCLIFELITNLQLTLVFRDRFLDVQMLILVFGASFRNCDTLSAHCVHPMTHEFNANDSKFLCFQVRDRAVSSLVEIYRHVGERVRLDLSKKGIPQPRYANNTQPACHYLFTNVCQLPLVPSFYILSHSRADSACGRCNVTGRVNEQDESPPSGKRAASHP